MSRAGPNVSIFSYLTVLSELASATVDAETAKIGDVVYTVSTSDPEGDAISFAATCDPAVDCPLEIRQSKF